MISWVAKRVADSVEREKSRFSSATQLEVCDYISNVESLSAGGTTICEHSFRTLIRRTGRIVQVRVICGEVATIRRKLEERERVMESKGQP